MDTTGLVDQGFTWTADRIAAIPADGLDAPTPCGDWDLRELLDHIVDVLTSLTDAVAAPGDSPSPSPSPGRGAGDWGRALADLAARNRLGWAEPGVMDRTMAVGDGTMSAPTVASSTLLELVVHGWDVGQATGEAPAIPDVLAAPILAFARGAIDDASRGDNFAADLGVGDTPSDQLLAYLGRKPL